jgi:hypothetical protein
MDDLAPYMPAIVLLATTALSGVAASDLFIFLRIYWRANPPSRWDDADRLVEWLLFTRGPARLTVLMIAATISLICTGIIAHAAGQPIGNALQRALVAMLASQLYHIRHMLRQPSIDGAAGIFEPEDRAE